MLLSDLQEEQRRFDEATQAFEEDCAAVIRFLKKRFKTASPGDIEFTKGSE
jgi:hypothetical protein